MDFVNIFITFFMACSFNYILNVMYYKRIIKDISYITDIVDEHLDSIDNNIEYNFRTIKQIFKNKVFFLKKNINKSFKKINRLLNENNDGWMYNYDNECCNINECNDNIQTEESEESEESEQTESKLKYNIFNFDDSELNDIFNTFINKLFNKYSVFDLLSKFYKNNEFSNEIFKIILNEIYGNKQNESKQDESKQDESKQDESKQYESKQDESKQDESKQDESKQDESKQDEDGYSEDGYSEDEYSKDVDEHKNTDIYTKDEFKKYKINLDEVSDEVSDGVSDEVDNDLNNSFKNILEEAFNLEKKKRNMFSSASTFMDKSTPNKRFKKDKFCIDAFSNIKWG